MSNAKQPTEAPAAVDPNADLRARLEIARLERKRLEDEQAAAEEARALTDELEREERGVRNAKALADAVAAHGPVGKSIAVVECSSGLVIVKRPHHVAFRKFQDQAAKGEGALSVDACEALVRPALVHPDSATFDKWAETESAIILRAANACAGLHGAKGAEKSGKY